jgi:hypothetical protein
MEDERDELYERIPWETLGKGGNDRHWLAYVVAGAIALGALAYSFTRNQPLAPPMSEVVATTLPVAMSTTAPPPSPSTIADPLVVAEADLYAVDPELLAGQAAAHAEWLAVEYVSFDGSEQSEAALAGLLPAGIPLPEAPEGTQVFVDWAGAAEIVETGPTSFAVSVLVRSLRSTAETGFVRQPARLVTVPVEITEAGPRTAGVPMLSPATPLPAGEMSLAPVPEEVRSTLQLEEEPIGGRQLTDGSWEVVVVVAGEDGVSRPVTLRS